VLFEGDMDISGRRVAITFRPAPNSAFAYAPFEIRLVDGVTYLELAKGVRRPAVVEPGSRWIAYTTVPGGVPVPIEAVPPAWPLNALQLPIDKPMAGVAFVDPPSRNPMRIAVRFANTEPTTEFTYSMGTDGRILSVTSHQKNQQITTVDYTYDNVPVSITVPSEGVQRIAPGATLYPTMPTS
jgi:hypothetical protein